MKTLVILSALLAATTAHAGPNSEKCLALKATLEAYVQNDTGTIQQLMKEKAKAEVTHPEIASQFRLLIDRDIMAAQARIDHHVYEMTVVIEDACR